MNEVHMMGRLIREPIYSAPAEKRKSRTIFTIAVERSFRRDGEAEADFFSVICFGNLAEFCHSYLHQGTKVVVNGSMQNDNYTNRDGDKVYSNQIFCRSVEFAESKRANKEYLESTGRPIGPVPDEVMDEFINADFSEDEIPFL